MSTVLITGASRGIGRATAKIFAKAGWDLLLISRDEESLKILSEELSNNKNRVYFKSLDLNKSELISSSIHEILEKGLCPDVLINNAGVAWTGNLISMPLEKWQWLFQVNLTSIFQICANVVPVMRKKGGLIINVSSHASRNAFPEWGAYCVSKAALDSFTRCLAIEERENSIRACTLTLGSVNTSLWDSDSVHSNFDRNAMLSEDHVAFELLRLAEQPSTQIIEDLTLMPATGTF